MKKWNEVCKKCRDCLHNGWFMVRFVWFLAIGQLAGISTVACFSDSQKFIVIGGVLLGLFYFRLYARAFHFANESGRGLLLRKHGLLSDGHEYVFVPILTLLAPAGINLMKGVDGIVRILCFMELWLAATEIRTFVLGFASLVEQYLKADELVFDTHTKLSYLDNPDIDALRGKFRKYYEGREKAAK